MNFLSSTPLSPERAKRIRRQREAKFNDPQDPNSTTDSTFTTQRRIPTTMEYSRHQGSRDETSNEGWRENSPSSSDYEHIHDSDIELNFSPASTQPSRPSNLSPEYVRSISRQSRGRTELGEGEQELGRGVEGDDEDSSAFEDGGDDARGRGRTRERRRDPELKRSMLEDALRSSLSTILSLAPAHAGMSQTPAMSHVSLASLLSSPRFVPPPSTSHLTASRPTFPTRRLSPFASALSAAFEEENDDEEEDEDYQEAAESTRSQLSNAARAQDVRTLSSEEDEDVDDERTELSPRPTSTASRAIPIPRTQSRSYPEARSAFPPSTSTSRDDTFFSPLHPSRPLGAAARLDYATSDSPPVYSRRRGGRRGRGVARGRGSGGGGGDGGGNSASPQPGPASLEERRRARMAAAQNHWTTERGGTTDAEDGGVERDQAFEELLNAARFFSDLSPRASHTHSLPTSFDSTRTTRPPPPHYPPALHTSTPHSPASEAHDQSLEGEEDDDPALASESVPTLGGLSSSGPEGDNSRSPRSGYVSDNRKDRRNRGKTETPDKSEKESKEKSSSSNRDNEDEQKGWLSWFGIGKTIQLKVWHLVGLCGVLVGIGWGASTLIKSFVSPNLMLQSSFSSPANASLTQFEFAPIQGSASLPATQMPALFL